LTDLSWTFDDIPSDGEAPPPPGAPRPPRRWVPRWRPRVWAAPLLTAAIVAATGAYAFTRVGWRQLEAQMAGEIAYEDERALARQVDLVLALQAKDSPAWLEVRAAEVALGWPAPPPAPNLLPAAQPPELLSVEALGGALFQAQVLRHFTDSSGRSYPFVLTQRYRNLGPGLWERLPHDDVGLLPFVTWHGARLRAVFPKADEAWMLENLPRIDAALQEVCEAWGVRACTEQELWVPYIFVISLAEWPEPRPPARSQAGGIGSYPAAFDIAPGVSARAERLTLLSPQVGGRPHDEAASQALRRALTVSGISYLADVIAGASRREADFFRDALVARAEVRLGLARTSSYTIRPEHYLPPSDLWLISRGAHSDPTADLPYRMQALAFMDFFLAGSPASADGALLASRRTHAALAHWLADGFGPFGPARLASWEAEISAHFERLSTLDWSHLEGLAYACHDEAVWALDQSWWVRDGRLQPISEALKPVRNWRSLSAQGLSPDGRYLAFVEFEVVSNLYLLDLHTDEMLLVNSSDDHNLLGWSAAGELVFAERRPRSGSQAAGFYLMAYAPGADAPRQLADSTIETYWNLRPQWLPNRSAFALTMSLPRPDSEGLIGMTPVLVAPGPPTELHPLAVGGHSPAFAPNGQSVAYVVQRDDGGGALDFGADIILLDLNTRSERVLVSRQHLANAGRLPNVISALDWSPDGEHLSFMASGQSYGMRLFTIATSGRDLREHTGHDPNANVWPAGFSADGRYLAYHEFGFSSSASRLSVVDLRSGSQQHVWVNFGGATWAPHGRLLVVGNRWGIYVLDPATSALRWLSSDSCQQAVWFVAGR
jgi:hypothetical protein